MQDALDRVLGEAPGTWSVSIRRIGETGSLAASDGSRVLRTASMGKVSLLIAVSRAVERGELSLAQTIRRDSVAPVHDSGLWQTLRRNRLALGDVATLVGAVSDNWATNALIDAVGGVDAAAAGAPSLGVEGVVLHDIVRDARGPEHPPTLSTGTAEGYTALFAALWQHKSPTSTRVLDWLSEGVDLSMVAGAFGLDPLAHADADRGVRVISKTGTDEGVRGDAGLVIRGDDVIAYASIANWEPTHPMDPDRDTVLATMRAIGELIRDAATKGTG